MITTPRILLTSFIVSASLLVGSFASAGQITVVIIENIYNSDKGSSEELPSIFIKESDFLNVLMDINRAEKDGKDVVIRFKDEKFKSRYRVLNTKDASEMFLFGGNLEVLRLASSRVNGIESNGMDR